MSSHSKFFSSFKQVENRIKLENTSSKTSETQVQESNVLSTLGSPLFLQPSCSQTCPSQQSSEPPQQFLSISQGFSLTHQNPTQTTPSDEITIANEAREDVDEIEELMMLLGMSEKQRGGFDFEGDDGDCDSCHCEGGFHSKIVGVEGPKCKKEVLRLDGWIKHFLNGDHGVEKKEPLRLAHLLLGKAAFISEGGFGGLDFPSTIQEFLHTDPPSN
ncbi:uncharacterized protein LOC131603064 isoform X1 [Vicia villosa]|uniref:uncharacterized protein LOC131603064 isoform X1 n=1 Tax=Vicia villosa TaxID=3911 RepID=UPI00273CD3A9|nr:uncharacterized protein LOC131603064 isoform X1 [Vicia villosa]